MKKLYFLSLLSFVISFQCYPQWVQKGETINHNGESYGYSMSINQDGTQIVISERSEEVVVYEFNGTSWVQKGNGLTDTDGSDSYGSIVANNYEGNIIAVGTPLSDYNGNSSGSLFVYNWNGNSWEQLGSRIDGASSGDQFAERSIGISEDGLTIASGSRMAFGNAQNSGHVRAFEWDTSLNDWVQKGNTLNGLFQNEVAGDFVSLSADGNILVYSDLTEDAGFVYVYSFDEDDNIWIQKGNTILGEMGEGWTGASVKISADGNTIVYGAPSSPQSNQIGLTKVYEFNGTDWVQKGNDIQGEQEGAQFGRNVSISADGNSLFVAAYLYDLTENEETITNVGLAKAYEWEVNSWVQKGETFSGIENNGFLGILSAAISKDGSSVVFRQRENGIYGAYVFEFDSNLSVQDINKNKQFIVYPNPIKNKLHIKTQSYSEGSWILFNQLGQNVMEGKLQGLETKINTEALVPGFYVLQIKDENSITIIVKKLLKI